MAKSLIPKSKAKTAYELLNEISALALAEPRRLRMGIVVLTNLESIKEHERPACGTVGCVAGWTLVLKGDPRKHSTQSRLDAAGEILGLDEEQQDELFLTFPDAYDGTADAAKQEVGLIRKFQEKYRAQLLAKKV